MVMLYVSWSGVLRQVQGYLSTRSVLEAFAESRGSWDILDVWLFACRYHLKDFLLELEGSVQSSQLPKMEIALRTASSRMQELPPDSHSVALCSLARMLEATICEFHRAAMCCTEALSKVRDKIPSRLERGLERAGRFF